METTKILIVDDEESIRRTLNRLLEKHDYVCALASDAAEARARIKEQEFALVLSDVNMPGESGLDLVRYILREHPDIAAVMVTALDDPQIANIALDLGAYGYIIKPFEANEVLINVSNALRRRRLEIENRAHREKLEQSVLERTISLRETISRLEWKERELHASREETIQRLSLAAEFRDDATARHTRRIGQYSALLASKLDLAPERCELIRIASPMHDIGKVGIPDYILLKPDKLTSEEFEIMKGHAEIGYRILTDSDAELLHMASIIAWSHHERIDGSGYPRGISGEEIPVEGRIVAIADVFDAITSKRVYKPALPVEDVVDIMRRGSGRQFDPAMLDLFLGSLSDVMAIRERYADR